MIIASYEGICVEFYEKSTHLVLPTFKLPANTKHILRLTR